MLLLAGEKHAAVAREVKVDSRTVRRWLKEPQFAQALNDEAEGINALYRQQTIVMIGRNVEKSIAATDLLDRIQSSDNLALTTRMRAAGQLMYNGYRWGTFIEKQKVEEERYLQRQNEEAAETEAVPTPKKPAQPPPEETRQQTPPEAVEPAVVVNAQPLPELSDYPAAVRKILVPNAAVSPAIAQNPDKIGHKRTSATDSARRERLNRMQREAEAAEQAAQAPAQSQVA